MVCGFAMLATYLQKKYNHSDQKSISSILLRLARFITQAYLESDA